VARVELPVLGHRVHHQGQRVVQIVDWYVEQHQRLVRVAPRWDSQRGIGGHRCLIYQVSAATLGRCCSGMAVGRAPAAARWTRWMDGVTLRAVHRESEELNERLVRAGWSVTRLQENALVLEGEAQDVTRGAAAKGPLYGRFTRVGQSVDGD